MIKKLNEIPGKNPFKVPENYFEEVNSKIISTISGYNQEVRKIGLYNRFRPYFLIAASVTGFILLGYATVKMLNPGRINSQESEVMFEEYPEPYINDIEIIMLEENAASLFLSEEVPDVNKTDIIDYLLLENIEISDIYEQL
ncbi:MAG: hypothetical protein Q7T72_08535 [Bacteroidales bacterium]|nr:hypothetical protein [Bacteroidales bacterium]MDP3002269.1 hypothetical protein [Bacteroidales bacterium]